MSSSQLEPHRTPSESLRTMAANLAMALEAQKRCWAKTLPEDAGKHLAHVVCKYIYVCVYMFAQICACYYMIVHVHVMFARIGRWPTADWWPDSFKFSYHPMISDPSPSGSKDFLRPAVWEEPSCKSELYAALICCIRMTLTITQTCSKHFKAAFPLGHTAAHSFKKTPTSTSI